MYYIVYLRLFGNDSNAGKSVRKGKKRTTSSKIDGCYSLVNAAVGGLERTG